MDKRANQLFQALASKNPEAVNDYLAAAYASERKHNWVRTSAFVITLIAVWVWLLLSI